MLYSWRAIEGSIATTQSAKGAIEPLQARAVNEHLSRLAIPASAAPHPVFPHRLALRYSLPAEPPLVSIVIPTKDHPEHIGRCLRSIFEDSTYPNFEVIVVDNQTTDAEALAIMQRHPVRRIEFNEKFNYSKANNIGVSHARGEFVILLNNDTEVVARDWIERLVGPFAQPDVAMTGALLVYPNDAVQHAGVVLGPRGTADHLMRHFRVDLRRLRRLAVLLARGVGSHRGLPDGEARGLSGGGRAQRTVCNPLSGCRFLPQGGKARSDPVRSRGQAHPP